MFALFTKKIENYEPTVETEVDVKRKRPILEEGWGIEFTLHNGDLKNYPIKVDHVEGGKVWFKDLKIIPQYKEMTFVKARMTHYGKPVAPVPTNAFPITIRRGDTFNFCNLRFEWVYHD